MDILNIIEVPYFKKGSGIHIKKKNRGKFTEYCNGKVTQECIDKAKKSKNPTLRKRATFALNARGWSKKHLLGGMLTNKILINSEGGYTPKSTEEIKLDEKAKTQLRSRLVPKFQSKFVSNDISKRFTKRRPFPITLIKSRNNELGTNDNKS